MGTATAGDGSAFVLATSLTGRMKGLLNPAVCAQGEILVLAPCARIHTFGMREPLDIAFVDRRGRVLKSVRGLVPCRRLSCRGAACTLERRCRETEPWFEPGDDIGLTACGAGGEGR
ncbi:MAG: DUF192 domain-containing protein [Coriobacteriales bacterium]|jgi:uncharacterized membrane protein (UPF0127 family)|nr:DUF192 domain-containing protein [Coriobacteriales bacterium]